MSRLTAEQLNKIKTNCQVDRLWSWSRINKYIQSPYEYYLKYILKLEEKKSDSVYLAIGSMAHSILEDLYTNKIEYKDMLSKFDDMWIVNFNIAGLKLDRHNEERNDKLAESYYKNLDLFFKDHLMIKGGNITVESFVKTNIEGNIFQGYIDMMFNDDEGCLNIIDFKTSTVYKGEKREKEKGQLLLYAIGIHQEHGIPYEKIKIAWNFLKYVNVTCKQKNGKEKVRIIERKDIGKSLRTNAKTWLNALKIDKDEIEKILDELEITNDINVLPEEVRKKFVIEDCYVYVDLDEEIVNELIGDISTTIKEIKYKEDKYFETLNDKVFYDDPADVKKNSYYFANLCGYTAEQHKPYGLYLEELEKKKNGEDLFSGIGEEDEELLTKNDNEDGELDLSWL